MLLVFALYLSGCHVLGSTARPNSRDNLVGWFKLTADGRFIGQDRIIPVFKLGGTYYSVCRGFEVPLKECPEGLEWALAPSDMAGTKIGFDDESNGYHIAIKDSNAHHYSSGEYVHPETQPLTRIVKPAGLLDATARRPRTNDDFIGCYQPVWIPMTRFEIRKDGEKYVAAVLMFGKPRGSWRPDGEPHEIKALPDGMGFLFYGGERINFTYNEALNRFELTRKDSNRRSDLLYRCPLARIPTTPSPEAEAATVSMPVIGIPSYGL
jgi:hypothetical protein